MRTFNYWGPRVFIEHSWCLVISWARPWLGL